MIKTYHIPRYQRFISFARYRSLLVFLIATSTALLLFSGIAGSAEITTAHYRIQIPVAIVQPAIESKERTPWGPVPAKTFVGTGSDGTTTYHFVEFMFSTERTLAANKLKHIISYFLKDRKCVAEELKQEPVLDAEGKVWPQVGWKGRCASGEVYRNLQFIANGRLYEIGVTSRIGQPVLDLDNALRTFGSHCSFAQSAK
jgi:hypothetical protein